MDQLMQRHAATQIIIGDLAELFGCATGLQSSAVPLLAAAVVDCSQTMKPRKGHVRAT